VNNEEEILDSGEIYKDPDDQLDLPQIELDIHEKLDPDWNPLLGKWSHFIASNKHYKMAYKDRETVTFQFPDKKSTIFLNALLIICFLEILLIRMDVSSLSILFFVFILMVVRYYSRPSVFFSKKNERYWKKAVIPLHQLFNKKDRITLELKYITAIQVLKRRQKEPYSCELNIVLADNSRLNILATKDRIKLEDNANELAKFLGVPVLTDFEHNKSQESE